MSPTIDILKIKSHVRTWSGPGFGLFINKKLITAFMPNTLIEKHVDDSITNVSHIDVELKQTSLVDVYAIYLNNKFIGKCQKGSKVYRNIKSLKN